MKLRNNNTKRLTYNLLKHNFPAVQSSLKMFDRDTIFKYMSVYWIPKEAPHIVHVNERNNINVTLCIYKRCPFIAVMSTNSASW